MSRDELPLFNGGIQDFPPYYRLLCSPKTEVPKPMLPILSRIQLLHIGRTQ